MLTAAHQARSRGCSAKRNRVFSLSHRSPGSSVDSTRSPQEPGLATQAPGADRWRALSADGPQCSSARPCQHGTEQPEQARGSGLQLQQWCRPGRAVLGSPSRADGPPHWRLNTPTLPSRNHCRGTHDPGSSHQRLQLGMPPSQRLLCHPRQAGSGVDGPKLSRILLLLLLGLLKSPVQDVHEGPNQGPRHYHQDG